MTQADIDQMKSADGLYVLGWKDSPGITHIVASMGGTIRQAVTAQIELDPSGDSWTDLELVAGPLTVQNLRDLKEKADKVEQYVAMLEHDLAVWKSTCQQAKLLLMTGSWDTAGPRALAKKLVQMITGYQASTRQP